MAADPRIEEVKTLLTEINLADVAEDTLFQARIAELSTTVATLQEERAGIIADLIARRDSLDARITALGG